MEVDAVAFAERGQVVERVDRSRGGGAGGADHRCRPYPGLQIALDRLLELVHAHALSLVGGNRAHGLESQTEHVGRAPLHHVGLARGVEGQRRPGGHATGAGLEAQRPVARQLEPHEVGHRAAGHHLAAGALGQAEGARQPAHQRGLHLVGAGAEPKAAEVLVEGGGDQVARGARDRARARHVGHEAGMAGIDRGVEGERAQASDQLGVGEALLGDVEVEPLTHRLGGELSAHGQLGQAGQELGPELHHLLPQLAGASRSPVEVADGFGSLSHAERP